MTTTARPAVGQHRGTTPRVLLVAGASVLVLVLVSGVVGATVGGAPAAFGSLVGGLLALLFLVFGSATVHVMTVLAPQMAVATALMTFTLQVVLVAAVFYALGASGAVGSTLTASWVAGGVIVAAAGWVVAQLVASSRARVPTYDIDLPGASQASPGRGEVRAR